MLERDPTIQDNWFIQITMPESCDFSGNLKKNRNSSCWCDVDVAKSFANKNYSGAYYIGVLLFSYPIFPIFFHTVVV